MQENKNMPNSIELAEGYNPFSDEAPQVQQINTAEVAPANEEAQTTNPPIQETRQEEQQSTPSFDPNQFVREKFGFDSVEQAEQEFKRVKDFKEPEFSFKDDISKTLFDAIKEGKSDEIYDILNQQKRLDKLTNAELNPSLAVDIIKTNIQNKYKDLTSDEVDLLFYESYFTPLKPEQGYDETDEDYATKLKTWQSQIDYVDKKMIIDAKVIRPELAKLKSELRLPDIYGLEQQEAQSREEFAVAQQARSVYERTLDSEFQSFSGFNVSVKDEEVDIPISFNVAEDERLAMKNTLSDFDSDTYFGDRWFTEDGKPKVQQIMADKYLLENRDKILQKVANEAASQRLLAHLKKTGNINLNQTTPQGTPTPNANAERDRLAAWAFSV
jgi:hypothetical protein